MSSDATPTPNDAATYGLDSQTQQSSPISSSASSFDGKNRFYLGVLLLGLVGLGAYGVDHRYKGYIEKESILALEAVGLAVTDLGNMLAISDPTKQCATDDCLVHIGDLRRPVKADLNRCPQISDDGLLHLSRNKQICMLGLSRTAVTDRGLAHLTGMGSLESLDLSATGITDAGLAELGSNSFAKLNDLNLGGTKVTDKGLDHLAGFHDLRFLVVERTDVTNEGAEKLRVSLPEVMVFGTKSK